MLAEKCDKVYCMLGGVCGCFQRGRSVPRCVAWSSSSATVQCSAGYKRLALLQPFLPCYFSVEPRPFIQGRDRSLLSARVLAVSWLTDALIQKKSRLNHSRSEEAMEASAGCGAQEARGL